MNLGVLSKVWGQVLCFLAMHDFKIVNATLGFGGAGGTKTVECQRCGHVTTRSN